MTELEARCDRCQLVFQVRPHQVVVALPPASEQEAQCELLYPCPGCAGQGLRLVPRVLALLLVGRGAAALPLLPRPVTAYPERRPEGTGPLTLDDLLALHELLERSDAVTDLAARLDEGS